MKKFVLLCFCLLFAAACSTGKPVEQSVVDSFIPGNTTCQQIAGVLGKPSYTERGVGWYTLVYSESHMDLGGGGYSSAAFTCGSGDHTLTRTKRTAQF